MSTFSGVDRICDDYSSQPRGFLTPPPTWKKPRRSSPVMPGSEQRPPPRRLNQLKGDLFHVIHKVPCGDSPYVRAKHVQLLDKDPGRAVSLFWSAINAGDRTDSALKDMAVVMKQLDRSDEAIEAIKSFRHLCPPESQESLDNILVELYKQSGRIEEEIEMLQLKLKQVEEGIAFGGKRTKIARSQGKKVQITIEKEYSRLLGNLAWAYMQQNDFKSAEEHYRKALSFESDKNKQCNLAICLMNMNKLTEAKFLLQAIKVSFVNGHADESYAKSYERAAQLMSELEAQHAVKANNECAVAGGLGGGSHLDSGFCFSKFCDDKNGVPQPSPLPCSVAKTSNGAFTEYLHEKRSNLDWRMTHCEYPPCKRPCEYPFGSRILPRAAAPFTKPQCSNGTRFCDQINAGTLTAFGSSCRKLSFELSIDSDSMRSLSGTGEWGKNLSDSHLMKPLQSSGEKMNSVTYDCQKSTIEGSNLPSDSVFYDDCVKTKTHKTNPCNQKKSWADMVEEEEQELEGWGSEFNDENVDLNIISKTPKLHHPENLSQRIELLDLGSGYYTQPEKATSVRRSLCFDQDHAEQLTTKVLNFEDQSLVLSSEDLSPAKLIKRRNRLQVFQDITHVPGSPSSRDSGNTQTN